MRIVACVNYYQDVAMLRLSLPALRRQADVLVCVDGAYRGFEPYNSSAASTDGSTELVSKYADILISPPWRPRAGGPFAWDDEITKRSAYLVGRPGDWYLVVDADEVLEGEVDRAAVRAREDWLVMLKRVGDSTPPYGIHRCFAHRPGIRYRGAHHAVHVLGGMIHPDSLTEALPGVTLQHHTLERERERVERKGAYYENALKPLEREFRAANALGRV